MVVPLSVQGVWPARLSTMLSTMIKHLGGELVKMTGVYTLKECNNNEIKKSFG